MIEADRAIPLQLRSKIEAMRLLDAVCAEWEGTPYAAGCCSPGPRGGVDCVRFVDAALQRLHEVALPALPRLAQDAAFHNPETVAEMVRVLEARYPAYKRRRCSVVRPGDTLLVAYEQYENHIAIAGSNPLKIWHATASGVAWTSLDALRSTGRVQRIYGPEERPC